MDNFIDSLHLDCPHLFTGKNCTEPWEPLLKDAIDIASIAGIVISGVLSLPTIILGLDLYRKLRTLDSTQSASYAIRLRKLCVALLFITLPFNVTIFVTGLTCRYPLSDTLGVLSLVSVCVAVSCYLALLVALVLMIKHLREKSTLQDQKGYLFESALIGVLSILFVSNLIPVIVLTIAGVLQDPVFAYRWSFGTNGFAGLVIAGLFIKVTLPVVRSMNDSIALDDGFKVTPNKTTKQLFVLKEKLWRFLVLGVVSVVFACTICLFTSITPVLYNPYIYISTMVLFWGVTFFAAHTAALILLYSKSWTKTSSGGTAGVNV